MKSKLLPALLATVALSLGAASASAQTAQPVPPGPTPAVTNLGKLGPELQALIAAHRDEAKALLDQRNTALQALKSATPAQRDALIANLKDIMKQHAADQKELAKEIRDAIKARRDQPRG